MSEKDLEENDQEMLHFQRILNAFTYYRSHSLKRVLLAEKYYHDLPLNHRKMIPHFQDNIKELKVCIEHNYEIIKLIVSHTDHMFENRCHSKGKGLNGSPPASEFDMDKVRSTLRQFVRDWSSEGQAEREACYGPVLREIQDRFPRDIHNTAEVKVLVPGAGLGRLALEIARRGYACQGNEFSLFMLFASNFVLNKCKATNLFTLYPWVHQYSNNRQLGDQTRAITFPDLNPCDLPLDADFSMAAGDFLEVYTEPASWDCVATVFFIDTAHNIISYIESIWHILKPGGYWINLGPLLYHFADMPNESSIELSYEEVKEVVKKFNFEIMKEEQHSVGYTQNPKSMLKYMYDCVFFVARKPESSGSPSNDPTQPHSLAHQHRQAMSSPTSPPQYTDHETSEALSEATNDSNESGEAYSSSTVQENSVNK